MNRPCKNLQPPFPAAPAVRAWEKRENWADAVEHDEGATSLVRSAPAKRSKPYWAHRTAYIRHRCIKRLKPKQVEAIFAADDYAARCRHRLNIFITIFWPLSASIPDKVGAARKRMREWLDHRGVQFHWAYVHENPVTGFNTHLLVHVPTRLQAAFMAAAPTFFGFDAGDAAFDIKRRYGSRERVVRYMCKGTDWSTAVRHRIHDGSRWKGAQGNVPFKRCGWSQNIGLAARQGAA